MSMYNCISKTLNIKDNNITFENNCLTEEYRENSKVLVYTGTLSPQTPKCCPKCGCINENYSIIKNGTKFTETKVPKVSNIRTIVRLRKQRYYCKNCNQTFVADTNLVKFNHSISSNTLHAALIDLKDKISVTDIAKRLNISHSSLNNFLHKLSSHFIVNKEYLPMHLSFDEFKSVRGIDAHMSFIFTGSDGRVIDIVQNRQLTHLKSYFNTYSQKARYQVRTICIDMYAPYIELIKACFPNAKIITDRFHTVQLVSRALNKTRVQVMKDNPKMHARLKRYWKLILKPTEDLDRTEFRKFTCFNYLMSESQVVDELLRIDSTFEATYHFYQRFLRNFRNKNIKAIKEIINNPDKNLSESMVKTIRTLKKHEQTICNSLEYPYSNGVVEGTNNLIKVIKRIAFGYRNYHNFRARILLIVNTMARLDFN